MLLEGCRKALWQINRVYFPHNEQPNGLSALLERFRESRALKDAVHAQLVGGANVALAYIRMHRPHLPLNRVLGMLSDVRSHFGQVIVCISKREYLC